MKPLTNGESSGIKTTLQGKADGGKGGVIGRFHREKYGSESNPCFPIPTMLTNRSKSYIIQNIHNIHYTYIGKILIYISSIWSTIEKRVPGSLKLFGTFYGNAFRCSTINAHEW